MHWIDVLKAPIVQLDFIQETHDVDLSLYRHKYLFSSTPNDPILSLKYR